MGRSSTPNNHNYVQNKENSDDNSICTSIKRLENLYNVETESSNFGGTDSYHDIRSDFNNNGVERDLNESMIISPTSSTSPQANNTHTSQKKFVVLGGVLRKVKKDTKGQELCVFCKNNGQPDYVYETHRTQDEYGRVVCPHLRIYTCPICKTTGDDAHTIKYCPKKPIITVEDTRTISRQLASAYRTSSSAAIAIPHRRTNAAYQRHQNNFQNYRF